MTYAIKWSPRAVKELRKLPRDVAVRIVKKVDSLKEGPMRFLEGLSGDPGFKLRVGDYRALVDVKEKEKIIAVRVLGHRKNIYKRRL
ncbi:MAG: type II toxin-antitoxin system RelE/ParE family toxin [Euryarchaeota archaeon]|nr:type II toxin-antitoxin system RelE/ParE family toxin [Euryarchaeota archaeon]